MEYHNYHSTIVEKYNEFEYIQGHIKRLGVDSGKEKNPVWIVYDVDSDKEILLMYCEPDNVCILCRESYKNIIDYENENNSGEKISWYIHQNGYIYGHTNNDIGSLAIHQLIMNHYGNGKGTKISSVDHIDRNPLNNTMANLRIATQEEQMLNSKGILPGTKRERQCIARELPEGITQDMMPKYITYNVNVWDKEKNKTRDFFRIEGHPIQSKVWDGSKSSKVSILDKLEKAKEVLSEMDNGNLPKSQERKNESDESEEEDLTNTNDCLSLPKNVSIYPERGRTILAFAKQIDGKRKSVKKTLSKLYDLSNLYNIELIEEVNIKLPILNCEVAKKYGKENAFIQIESEIVNKYIEDTKSNFPTFVRIQNFNAVPFLVFNKDSDEERLSITKKLPNNYNLNYELHIFNTIIIEKYGNENKLDLRDFPQTANEDIEIEMPENMYGNLNCKEPYLFKINNTTTSIMKLPLFYNMQDELNSFNERCNVIETNNAITQKELCKNTLPKNVCISLKKDVYQLLYQQRTKDIRHSKAISLPSLPTELFDINIKLVKLNDEICKKFGEEFSILV